MAKFSLTQRFLIVPLIAVPIAMFFVARSAASWRPQLVGRQSNVQSSWNRGSHFLRLSPDEKWLVSEGEDQVTSTLWSLEGVQLKHGLQGTEAVFSKDSRLIATCDMQLQELFLNDRSRLKWRKRLKNTMEPSQIGFAENNSQVQYRTEDPDGVDSNLGDLLVTGDLLISLDAHTGKELSSKKLGATIWQRQSLDNHSEVSNMDSGEKISLISPDADKLIFSLSTSNSSDRWDVASDGKRLWVSQGKQNRFDIHDAKTGRKLWSYSSTNTNSGEFNCYPSWGNDGKTLATIEGDTLLMREAESGKVLLTHKNNLPAPLVSWAFTSDGNSVYLMDSKGEIFRQRLK